MGAGDMIDLIKIDAAKEARETFPHLFDEGLRFRPRAAEMPRPHRRHEMSDVTDLIERAQFLCDRLDELEWHDGNLEDGLRDYMGHVDPAHARLKAALERLTRPADVVEAAWQWRVMDEEGEYTPWVLCYGEPMFVGIEKQPLYTLTNIKQTDAVEAERERNYATFTDGMEAAAEICGSLAETTYDDSDAFEAATGCEAEIMKVVRQQRAEQAAAIRGAK